MNRIGLIILGDLIAFWISLVIILFVRFGLINYKIELSIHLVPFFCLYLFWVLIFYLFGLYDLLKIKPTIPYLSRFIMAISASFIVGIILFYFIPIFGISPKTNLIFQIIGFGLISFLFRRIVYILFSKNFIRPIILIGSSDNLNKIDSVISNNPQFGLSIIARVDNFSKAILNYSKIKNPVFIFENIPEKISEEKIYNLYKNNSEILNVAQVYEKYLQKIPIDYIDQYWLVENINAKESVIYLFMRKIIDIIFSISILIITSPIIFIAIIARLIEDGKPIFIKQKRVGRNGEIFNLYKIRSMVVLSPDGSAETTEAIWSTGKDDKRITRVGKIIRRLHIDEIPQMINIIKGDITLVGPRPERPEFTSILNKEIPYYSFRHIIKPGFTGWAQIKYKYASTNNESKEKFEYDLYYIKNKNIFIDIGIILRTIQIIFTH